MSPLQAQYQRDGYAICHGLVDGPAVQALRDETVAMACGQRGAIPYAERGLEDLARAHLRPEIRRT